MFSNYDIAETIADKEHLFQVGHFFRKAIDKCDIF